MDAQLRALIRQYLATPGEDLAIQILVAALRSYDPQVLGPLAKAAVESMLHQVNLTPALVGELPTAVYPRTAQQIQEVIDAIVAHQVLPTKCLETWRDDNETCGAVSFLVYPNSSQPRHYRLNLWGVGSSALEAFQDAVHSPFLMERAIGELDLWLDGQIEAANEGNTVLDINMWTRHPQYPLWETIAGPLVDDMPPHCILVDAEVREEVSETAASPGIQSIRLVVIGQPRYYYRGGTGVASFEIPVSNR